MQVQQAIAIHIDREAVTRCQLHRAEIGFDKAVVDDVRANEQRKAAISHFDATFVDNGCISITSFIEIELAILIFHEVFVGDVAGGGNKAANIDFRGFAKPDTLGVDKGNRTISFQVAQKLRWAIAVLNAEKRTVGGLLVYLNGFIDADIEGFKIGDKIFAMLINSKLLRCGAVCCGTLDRFSARRQIRNHVCRLCRLRAGDDSHHTGKDGAGLQVGESDFTK